MAWGTIPGQWNMLAWNMDVDQTRAARARSAPREAGGRGASWGSKSSARV